MKRYLLFMCGYYYPCGGIDDLQLAFNTMDELDDFFASPSYPSNQDFFNMYDCLENRSLYGDLNGCEIDNILSGNKKEDYKLILEAFLNFK